MAPARPLDRPIRPRQENDFDYDEEEAELESEAQDSEDESGPANSSSVESNSGEVDDVDEDDTETSAVEELKEPEDLKDISFGALAHAQAALGPVSRKRKLADTEPVEKTSLRRTQRQEDRQQPKQHASRSSKHAPAVQSSRRTVTRHLNVFDPNPALKSRDPRFDPLVQSSNTDPNASSKANKSYSFLTTYQADEILSLKSQIKKSQTTDPALAATLKRQLMSLESKLRRSEAAQHEKEVLQKHKREEREAIRSGVKERPYYLKRSEVRKEVQTARFEGMSKKAREKAEERKRKRVKGKESKNMPWERRER